MGDEALNTGSARLPSWATDAKAPLRPSMFFVYALSFVAILDIFTPLPGVAAIVLAARHVRHNDRGARLALAVAIVATAISAVIYWRFLT